MYSLGKALAVKVKGLLNLMPDVLMDRLPVLGRVCVREPGGRRLYMRARGRAGKDRTALKVWRQGLSGYEPETLGVFQALLRGARLFVDVGANTGIFSLVAAQDPSRRVIAFEPVPPIFQMLRANTQLNRLNNLTAEPMAVSDAEGELVFYVTRTNGGIPTDSSSMAGFRGNTRKCVLPAVTLDNYLRDKGLGPVDLLKIDAECAEPRVLRGARHTIERDRPFILCEVLESVDREAIHSLMGPLEYLYFHLTPAGLVWHDRLQGNPGRGYRNYLFVARERRHEMHRYCDEIQATAA